MATVERTVQNQKMNQYRTLVLNILKNKNRFKRILKKFDPQIPDLDCSIKNIFQDHRCEGSKLKNIRKIFNLLVSWRFRINSDTNEWSLAHPRHVQITVPIQDSKVLNLLAGLISISYPELDPKISSIVVFLHEHFVRTDSNKTREKIKDLKKKLFYKN